MATEILLPRQGQSVESCLILEWKKSEGDEVREGEIICEVETDKATFEVESTATGVLLKQLVSEGDDVPVLAPIALVGEAGEKVEAPQAAKEKPEEAEHTEPEEAAADREAPKDVSRPELERSEGTGISPRARNLAESKGLSTEGMAGSGPGGRIIERDVKQALEGKSPLTPGARAAVSKAGGEIPGEGTGIGGRVTSRDVGKAGEETAPRSATEQKTAAQPAPGEVTEKPLKGVRKLIAERMHESLQSTAQLTLHSSADARSIMAYRKVLKSAPEEMETAGITINDLVLFAVSRILPRFPMMNAELKGEVIREYADVNLGLAVDTPRGLMVPVIRGANRLSLKEISREVKRLASACQEGKINPDELSGGTFTVTNLGALGVERFTPVLNAPQVGILGVCSVVPKPVLTEDGQAEFIPHIGLSLTIDHQAVDGAPGARFLKAVAEAIANLDALLAG